MYIYMNLYGFFSLNVKKAFIEDIDEIGIHIHIYIYILYTYIYTIYTYLYMYK